MYYTYEEPTQERVAKLWTEGDPVTNPNRAPQRYNPYSNTYNPGWRDNPAFRWSNNNNGGNQARQYVQPQRVVPYVAPQLRNQYPPQQH